MSNYVVTTDFAAKDALPSGNPGKLAQGTQLDTELDNIATAIATKEDTANKGVSSGYAGLDGSGDVPDAQIPPTIPRLGNSNTFTGTQQLIQSTNPILALDETDASANERLWRITTSGGDFFLGTRTDVDGTGATALTVTRTGTTVDSINLQATVVQVNSQDVRNAAILTAGTLADARVAQSNVTQHQAALSIAGSQLTGTIAAGPQANLALNASQITSDVGTQSGNFSVTSAQAGDFVVCDSASTITVTVGNNCLGGAGKAAIFIRRNTGAVTFSASGVTIRTPAGSSITQQHGKAGLVQIDATNFELSGNV